MRECLELKVVQAKLLDARCVHNPAARREPEHLGEGGGMFSLVVRFRNFANSQFEPRLNGIDQGRFAYTAMAETRVVLL